MPKESVVTLPVSSDYVQKLFSIGHLTKIAAQVAMQVAVLVDERGCRCGSQP